MVPRRALDQSRAAPDPIPPTVAWRAGSVRLIDQRALPARLRYVSCTTADDLVAAIRDLVVRGAPALGVCGAFGVALAAQASTSERVVEAASKRVADARPTAVNLAWGVARALDAYRAEGPRGALECARNLAAADVAGNQRLGAWGATFLPDRARVLTHCNAGSLACVGYGTALGVIRAHYENGGGTSVWVDETRPVGQGARLTAWELDRLGIPYRVIVDAAAASLFAAGEIDAVVVGADRIAANGDVANKIGTYGVAVLARAHGVPFYVAAPMSTIDPATSSGAGIVIEERSPDEVALTGGVRTVPRGAQVFNPAFDVTPARLVSALFTDGGVVVKPTKVRLRTLLVSR